MSGVGMGNHYSRQYAGGLSVFLRRRVRATADVGNQPTRQASSDQTTVKRSEAVDVGRLTDEPRRLEQHAARSGREFAVDRVDGHSRAGFLVMKELGESAFVQTPTDRTKTQRSADSRSSRLTWAERLTR